MNRTRAVPLVVAVLALSTLAVAATTLETTVTTDPEEEIDPNWERLPLSEQAAATLQSEISDGAGGSAESTAAGGGNTAEGSEPTSSGLAASGSSTLITPPENTLLDRLLAVLGTVVGVLLGGAVVAGTVGLVYRYRGQYDALFAPPEPTPPMREPPSDRSEWPAAEPTTVVDRAWVRVVSELDPAQPATTTPAECLTLARRADLDVAAVESITTAFERVHYGGSTPAEERARARDGLKRLTGGQR